MPYLHERLVNYSQKHQAEIEPIIKEWMCPYFIECFQYDFHLCRHNFQDFKIAADCSEEYSQSYKSECIKHPNALQWYFALYKEWNKDWSSNAKLNFYNWITNKKKEIPMPLPFQKEFHCYNVYACVKNNL